MGVGDEVESFERADLRLLRHHAERARIDVPAGHGDGHRARRPHSSDRRRIDSDDARRNETARKFEF